MRRNYYLYIFLVLGSAVVLFAFTTFVWDEVSTLLAGDEDVEVELHRPRVFLKGSRRVLQYNRIFYNRTMSQVVLKEKKVCFVGGNQGDYCDGKMIDYLMGPSSYLVQTNNYLFLTEGVSEVMLEFKGEKGSGGEEVLVRMVLEAKGTDLRVKEGLPVSFEPLPSG